ncbi:UDP-glucose 4-epimerase GalE [Limisalsivibrio acetivorans]|uniref:UDP-glucose 4-epimerase GalE n=1 Tax=Limisalsivibrio acetivorans TaxID=1304888 RepID=UPI0003B3F5E2|nr:UDP-glucose 4-epimerase GalE [Limisalsivibrio acetivorans]
MKVFVSGGAGYIGSHVVKQLGEAGHDILVYDNLSTGHRSSVLYGELVEGDLADMDKLNRVMGDFTPDAVMHFAASIRVDESVRDPLKYFTNNTRNSINLLGAMKECGVDKFIFSSTAAVYGQPENNPITEDEPLAPINPYGTSKMLVEKVLEESTEASGIRFVSLRYFNVAGADPDGKLGLRTENASHLIVRLVKAAKGEIERMSIFGTDYPTEDGTCVRDYIHVADLASAHLDAMAYLDDGGSSDVFNLGYGKGYSVRQVIDSGYSVLGDCFETVEGERREGDPAALVADSSKARKVLGWVPKHDSLDKIISTAWEWEKSLP